MCELWKGHSLWTINLILLFFLERLHSEKPDNIGDWAFPDNLIDSVSLPVPLYHFWELIKLNKKLQEKAVQVEFAPLKGKVLEKWIVDYVTAAGRKIDFKKDNGDCTINNR